MYLAFAIHFIQTISYYSNNLIIKYELYIIYSIIHMKIDLIHFHICEFSNIFSINEIIYYYFSSFTEKQI